jgi:ribonuclease Z
MKVHFLGTTGYHPNDQRHTMCVMIPELGIVLDAGTGFFRARDLLATTELNLLLSHAHLDHLIGLSFLFDVLFQKEVRANLFAMGDKLAAIEGCFFHPTLFPVRPPFTAHEIEKISKPAKNKSSVGGEFSLAGGVLVRWFPVEHPGGAIGFRLSLPGGKSLAYVTDTTAALDAAYLAEIEDVDLLIHECYFDDGVEDHARLTGHSCLTPVIQVARQSRARQTVLVHLNPLAEWAPPADKIRRLAGDLNLVVPADQMVLEF